jgi:hypothetical protein
MMQGHMNIWHSLSEHVTLLNTVGICNTMVSIIIFNKMFISVLTQHQYISFVGYMFRFLQQHLQANVNYREIHSVCTHINGIPLCFT